MPSKKEYIKKALKAFGNNLPEDYDTRIEKGINDIYKVHNSTGKSYDEIKKDITYKETEQLDNEIYSLRQVDAVAIENGNIEDLLEDKENKLSNIKKDLNELFEAFDSTNPDKKMSKLQTENGIAMYADAKGKYEQLPFLSRLFAHILPAAIFAPADMLNRYQACKEVVYDKCKLNPSKVEPYVDKLISDNTTIYESTNEKKFNGVDYCEDYKSMPIVEIEDYPSEIEGIENDTNLDKQATQELDFKKDEVQKDDLVLNK